MEHTLTADSNQKSIAVKKGDTISVELDETPTAGYNWEVARIDENICELVSSEYKVYTTAGIGGGGSRKMIFSIKNAGTGSIALENRQRWSGDVYQRFNVTISVN